MANYDEKYFKSSLAQINEAVRGLTDEQLTYKQADHSWSIKEVVQHLVDHHLVVSFRIRAILAASEPVNFVSFNQDEWVSSQRGNAASIAVLLAFYEALIDYNHHLFLRLEDDDLQKTGINLKGLEISIEQIVKGLVDHVHHHIQQINRIKQSLINVALQEEKV